jgi:hypothetical protein
VAARQKKWSFRHFEESDLIQIWDAYKDKSFKLPEMNKIEFTLWFNRVRKRSNEVLVVCDGDKLIAFVAATFDGWKYEPHVEFFRCASGRDKLESTIAFFSRIKEVDTIGVIVVKALGKSENLFDHVCKRGILEFVGIMKEGDYRGDEFIYSAAGNATTPTRTTTPTAGWLL